MKTGKMSAWMSGQGRREKTVMPGAVRSPANKKDAFESSGSEPTRWAFAGSEAAFAEKVMMAGPAAATLGS